jgi:hypothetical protein
MNAVPVIMAGQRWLPQQAVVLSTTAF